MSVVTPAETRSRLRQTQETTDGELQDLIDEAEAAVGLRVGPLEPDTVTVRIVNTTGALALPITPVISLTSVTPVEGTALTVGDLHTDLEAGVVTFNDGAAFGDRAYDVVYVAGRAVGACPPDLKAAVKEMIALLWKRRTGSGTKPGTPEDNGLLLDTLLAEHEDLGI